MDRKYHIHTASHNQFGKNRLVKKKYIMKYDIYRKLKPIWKKSICKKKL